MNRRCPCLPLIMSVLWAAFFVGACGSKSSRLPHPSSSVSSRSLGRQALLADAAAGKSGPQAETTAILGDVPMSANHNIDIGYPDWLDVKAPLKGQSMGLANSETKAPEIIISRRQYLLSWNPHSRELNWAAWRLSAQDLGTVGRRDRFTADSDLEHYLSTAQSGHAVDPNDYRGTCFDRGHQVPSGDRTDQPENNAATFNMSNIIPQTAWLNRGVWEHLEHHSRELVRGTDSVLFIYAGPVYADGDERWTGLNHDIAVPTKNFKILVRGGDKPEVLAAVMMPNVTSTGSDPLSDHEQACADQHQGTSFTADESANDWQGYSMSVADIEKESDLDFSFIPGVH